MRDEKSLCSFLVYQKKIEKKDAYSSKAVTMNEPLFFDEKGFPVIDTENPKPYGKSLDITFT